MKKQKTRKEQMRHNQNMASLAMIAMFAFIAFFLLDMSFTEILTRPDLGLAIIVAAFGIYNVRRRIAKAFYEELEVELADEREKQRLANIGSSNGGNWKP